MSPSEAATGAAPATTTVAGYDGHALNFGPQHPSAHGVLRLILRARRRGGRAGRSAYRPAASRHREADRVQDLHPGGAVFRPTGLHQPDVAGARLRAGHREAAGHRGARAREVDPHTVLRTHAGAEPSAERHHLRARRRRHHAGAVGVRGTREAARILRGGLRRAVPLQLFPPRRRGEGPAGRAGGADRRLGRAVSEIHRRPGSAADGKPHLEAAHRGYWRDRRRDGARLGLLRPAAARLRRAVGSAARPALRNVRPRWTSRCRWDATATATTATSCASGKCARASRSSTSAWSR